MSASYISRDPFAGVMGVKRGLAPAEIKRLEADVIREGRTVSVWFYGESDDRVMVVGDLPGASQYEESDGPFEVISGASGSVEFTISVKRGPDCWMVDTDTGIYLPATDAGIDLIRFDPEEFYNGDTVSTPLQTFYENAGLTESTASYLDETELFTQVLRLELPVKGLYTIYPRGMTA